MACIPDFPPNPHQIEMIENDVNMFSRLFACCSRGTGHASVANEPPVCTLMKLVQLRVPVWRQREVAVTLCVRGLGFP